MSVLEYCMKIENPRINDMEIYRISPMQPYSLPFSYDRKVPNLTEDEIQHWPSSPMLRIVDYEIECGGTDYNEGKQICDLIGNPSFSLTDVVIESDGRTNAEFINNEDGESNSCYFEGYMAVESRYDRFSAKTYRFFSYSSCDEHYYCDILEEDVHFIRSIGFSIPYDKNKEADMIVSEYRP